MFITIKYGHNESLLCNPSCAVVNLLASIKRRTGFGSANVLLDLSDETGSVKDLDLHKFDYATKYLRSHATYILVQKHILQGDDADPGMPLQYTYVPLLDNYIELFPEYKVHVTHIEKKKKPRVQSKSPSPAGYRGQKGVKSKAPSRSSSRKR